MLVEICANSLQSALNAEMGGADRIELCSELAVGGITPSYGLLKSIKAHISIPVHVLIRPRSGDFTYSDLEFEIMKKDIAICRDLGFEGIVAGVLHRDFTLDEERTRSLIEASGGLHFTFHRAFDWVRDPISTFGKLEHLGVQTLLSSGQKISALEGIELLTRLYEKATTCTILPGGGIGMGNVQEFKKRNFKAVHLSGSTSIKKLKTTPLLPMYSQSKLKDDEITVTDLDIVRHIINEAK
ncbi:copper homeostasis protein CutC [Ulvibacterium sp.]|uniref:copper homeostasis protein CutC n=1 Tax=Ulvibacterium sp. TaxID=2665914 RepID=UPI00260D7C91|nr:copper homeostasis protein CutC [Ulvibacterium sp.]